MELAVDRCGSGDHVDGLSLDGCRGGEGEDDVFRGGTTGHPRHESDSSDNSEENSHEP